MVARCKLYRLCWKMESAVALQSSSNSSINPTIQTSNILPCLSVQSHAFYNWRQTLRAEFLSSQCSVLEKLIVPQLVQKVRKFIAVLTSTNFGPYSGPAEHMSSLLIYQRCILILSYHLHLFHSSGLVAIGISNRMKHPHVSYLFILHASSISSSLRPSL